MSYEELELFTGVGGLTDTDTGMPFFGFNNKYLLEDEKNGLTICSNVRSAYLSCGGTDDNATDKEKFAFVLKHYGMDNRYFSGFSQTAYCDNVLDKSDKYIFYYIGGRNYQRYDELNTYKVMSAIILKMMQGIATYFKGSSDRTGILNYALSSIAGNVSSLYSDNVSLALHRINYYPAGQKEEFDGNDINKDIYRGERALIVQFASDSTEEELKESVVNSEQGIGIKNTYSECFGKTSDVKGIGGARLRTSISGCDVAIFLQDGDYYKENDSINELGIKLYKKYLLVCMLLATEGISTADSRLAVTILQVLSQNTHLSNKNFWKTFKNNQKNFSLSNQNMVKACTISGTKSDLSDLTYIIAFN
jgi:hypothetical protein